tara:strand:- start:1378 stop:1866 length:489 start_codon:yes stop_codon:yes gene_type:complete
MVNIVIMRHGEAEPMTQHDSQRQLTQRGTLEAQQMASWLQSCYGFFDCVWVSPYVRACQTADVMLTRQGPDCQLQRFTELVPEGSAQQIQTLLDAKLAEQPDARILLVTHMPLVSFLVETLTHAGQTPVFSTAGICCIDYNPAQGGRLLEITSPQELILLSH